MALTNVPSVNNNTSTEDIPKIASMKDIEKNPEFFPLWVEELQRKNMGTLLSATASDGTDQSSDETSLMDANGSSGTDFLSSLTGSTDSSDPLANLFSTTQSSSGLDLSSFSPTTSLQSYEVAQTLQGLQDYSNAKESKAWLGQLVTYLDPTDNITKSGRVTRVDIENVSKPLFRIDDKIDLTLDDIKAFNSASTQSNDSASTQSNDSAQT